MMTLNNFWMSFPGTLFTVTKLPFTFGMPVLCYVEFAFITVQCKMCELYDFPIVDMGLILF
jgi:hypothetical protein